VVSGGERAASEDPWEHVLNRRWPDHPGGVEQAYGDALHWGRVGPDLLDDPTLFARYSWCFHVAAHAWAIKSGGVGLGPVGRYSLRTPRGLDREGAQRVEATAVLVEALAVEYARDLHRLVDFGIAVRDVDWLAVGDRISTTRGLMASGAGRGPLCRRHGKAAERHLDEPVWFGWVAGRALADWDRIEALADALGDGRVLEIDDACGALDRW